MRKPLGIFVCLLLLLCPAAADEQTTLTTTQVADLVLEAIKGKDPSALKVLAEKGNPDRWLVADELCSRSEYDAAEAFAKSIPGKDGEALAAYVGTRRGKTDDADARKAFADIDTALRANDAANALAAADEARAPANTIAAVRIAIARGYALRGLRKLAESSTAFLAAADAAKTLGWNTALGTAYREAGISAAYRRDVPGALDAWERALPVLEVSGAKPHLRQVLVGIARIHKLAGEPKKALPFFERALVVSDETGDKRYIADSAANLGLLHRDLGALEEALPFLERAEALQKELGNTVKQAWMLKEMGEARLALGEFALAQAHAQRALFLFEQLDDKNGMSIALGNLGYVHLKLGDPVTALSFQERSLSLAQEMKDEFGVAATLVSIGNVNFTFGNNVKALRDYGRALEVFRKLNHKAGGAAALASIGLAHHALGNYARALAFQESALGLFSELGDQTGVATAYGNLGNIHDDLGDHERSRSYTERALAIYQELNQKPSVALQRSNLGNAFISSGDYDRALEQFERALLIQREIMDKPGIATVYENIGIVHARRGEHAKALGYMQKALALFEQMKNRGRIATNLSLIGETLVKMGRRAEGLKTLGRAVREARSRRMRPLLVRCLRVLAGIHLDGGEVELALSEAQQALVEVEFLLGRLADVQGATARGRYTEVFEIGAVAAARVGDAGMVVTFLESRRAGSLLEALGGRKSLRWEDLPESLRRAESLADAQEAQAREAYRKASESGDLRALREASAALEAASKQVTDVAARNQRSVKGQAKVFFYPRAATLEEIQDKLEEDEALVIYGLCRGEALAMVIGRKGERIVTLGKVTEVTNACAALDVSSRKADSATAFATLRKLLVEPLALEDSVARVLVSPEGPLGYVPFGALFEQAVALTPSGTTHVLLKEETRASGIDVLALGDPDYAGLSEGSGKIYLRGRALTPLPGTRKEAKAVGDQTLLGADANETTLRAALATKKRWRAVHLACHGLLDPDRPSLSFLALSSAKGEDGCLTALEVLRMDFQTDLAVLSACDTGKGKIAAGEGIVGLTRAFMYAGAPRVICSLWKVDDEATQALMVKFYELWNPKEGDGIDAAAALKQAQAYVRGHKQWAHPFYWAAWVLWGLPE